jgi:hypothetical protein
MGLSQLLMLLGLKAVFPLGALLFTWGWLLVVTRRRYPRMFKPVLLGPFVLAAAVWANEKSNEDLEEKITRRQYAGSLCAQVLPTAEQLERLSLGQFGATEAAGIGGAHGCTRMYDLVELRTPGAQPDDFPRVLATLTVNPDDPERASWRQGLEPVPFEGTGYRARFLACGQDVQAEVKFLSPDREPELAELHAFAATLARAAKEQLERHCHLAKS